MKRALWSLTACALLSVGSLHAQPLFFDDFEHGVSRSVSGGTWHTFNDGSFFGNPQWLDAYDNHPHEPGGVLSARAVEADPWVYNSYADFGATGGSLRAIVYLFEDKNHVPPYPEYDNQPQVQQRVKVTSMFSLWGDSATGPEAYSDYLQLGVVPTFPGGGTTYGIRTKYNDDHGLGTIDTGVEREKSQWMKLEIDADSMADGGQVRFFIDDSLVGTSQRSGPDLRWVMMGGTTYSYENFWYDDISVLQAQGDYNGDGQTDAADYVLWRKKTNPNNLDGYATWRENFGIAPLAEGSNLASQGASVPEPAVLWTLALTGLVLLSGWRRRSR